ncbi:hypothetical protein [Halomonas korlensis]|uniref:Uncharacterized protein n=1 Tax=Halomonas korlensis TaxID=463301 RepID=A0A1I7IZ62_9GAMM|nr:hypothetical protein [Halomonas korlensis]SFU78220.1 hypothetical protein SAMN04487955_108171 [Halomonas korlensis]
MINIIKSEIIPVLHYGLGLLAGCIFVALAIYLGYLLAQPPGIKTSDYIQILVLVVITMTLCVSLYVQKHKEKHDESQIYLEKSIDLIKKAYDVLNGQGDGLTSERVAWVTAARLIKRADELSAEIGLRSHRNIFQSEHDYQRHRFGHLLKVNDRPLPTEFFLGKGHVPGSIGKSAENTISGKGSSWIPLTVVSEIYRFRAFPEHYEDPLENTARLSNRELERLWLFDDKGVHDYFIFRKHFSCVNTSVYEIERKEGGEKVAADEIDQKMASLSGTNFHCDE